MSITPAEQARINELKLENSNLVRQLDQSQEKAEKLDEELIKAQKRIAELEEQSTDIPQDAEQRIAALEEDLKKATDALRSTQKKLKKAETKLAESKSNETLANTNLSSTQNDLAQVKGALFAEQTETKRLQGLLSRAQKEKEEVLRSIARGEASRFAQVVGAIGFTLYFAVLIISIIVEICGVKTGIGAYFKEAKNWVIVILSTAAGVGMMGTIKWATAIKKHWLWIIITIEFLAYIFSAFVLPGIVES